ncbi:protein NDRG3 isoform X2 [Bicyclus anynana]|uniref:Protein NDRG3 isoform X2 n=1 Tax=Bicyclus anynana TaxID=110368 RepID=A0A6J1NQ23_BICAN|nr:protein NDRG3 isoform X2 [Bicyclus anynana]
MSQKKNVYHLRWLSRGTIETTRIPETRLTGVLRQARRRRTESDYRRPAKSTHRVIVRSHCKILKNAKPSKQSNKQQPRQMPTNQEATALLSVHPADSMVDIELRNIPLLFPGLLQAVDGGCVETYVHTDRGAILVATQGDRHKPAIITYHDVGLNYKSFNKFFKYVDMQALMENFCVFHITAPGQEEGAATLPPDYFYPTMEELAKQISFVLVHFGIKSFIGFGVGVGANVLARFAITNPDKVDALMLVNCSSTQAGWLDWVAHKMISHMLRARGMAPAVIEYLICYHLGRGAEERNLEATLAYREQFARECNPDNLALLLQSYIARSDLGIARDGGTLRPPVVNLVGAFSPALNDTVTLNARLDPTSSTWMKISDCAMPLEEEPAKVSEAFRLFLQGEGYAVVALQRVAALHARPRAFAPALAPAPAPALAACSGANNFTD